MRATGCSRCSLVLLGALQEVDWEWSWLSKGRRGLSPPAGPYCALGAVVYYG